MNFQSHDRVRLVIDGVFFQLNSTGIARVWSSILKRWAGQPFAKEILILNRGGTAPVFPNLRYRTIPTYTIGQGAADREMLQSIVDEERGELFASTYYTSVPRTKTLQIVYDMIPEVFGWDVTREPAWVEKHQAFRRADSFICISDSTQNDLLRFFPEIKPQAVTRVYLGIDAADFRPPSRDDLLQFLRKYSLNRPYFLMVGSGDGYKNGRMLLDALSLLPSNHGFEVVMVTRGHIPASFRESLTNGTLKVLPLSDEELTIAYTGAVAFVCPSLYEGFGLPILEAMSCNCPVISNNKASLPEVGGDAALYATTVEELASALCEVQKPEVQNYLVRAGNSRVPQFSWDQTAREWWQVVCSLTDNDTVESEETFRQSIQLINDLI